MYSFEQTASLCSYRFVTIQVVDMKNPKSTLRCWKCHSPLRPEITADLRSGGSIQQYVCFNCGRRWYGEWLDFDP
jgi:RNase P subunit RPR2